MTDRSPSWWKVFVYETKFRNIAALQKQKKKISGAFLSSETEDLTGTA